MLTAFACTHDGPAPTQDLRSASWIDLYNPTESEISAVREATGLNVPTNAEVSEIEASSRLVLRGKVLYLSVPLMTLEGGLHVVSSGFVLSPEQLLTVRFAPSLVFDAYMKHVQSGDFKHPSGAHIMIGLFGAIIDRQADALEAIRSEFDKISHRIFALAGKERAGRKIEDRTLRDTLAELGRIGDQVSNIREIQLGAALLLPFIETNTKDWLPPDLHVGMASLRDDIGSLRDFDEHLSNKLQFLLDATLGFINIAQNDVMKVMTIASVVGIPPVLIAGIYGMNFKNIPEYDWAWGYQFGWALIVLTTLIPLAVFRWRKWI